MLQELRLTVIFEIGTQFGWKVKSDKRVTRIKGETIEVKEKGGGTEAPIKLGSGDNTDEVHQIDVRAALQDAHFTHRGHRHPVTLTIHAQLLKSN